MPAQRYLTPIEITRRCCSFKSMWCHCSRECFRGCLGETFRDYTYAQWKLKVNSRSISRSTFWIVFFCCLKETFGYSPSKPLFSIHKTANTFCTSNFTFLRRFAKCRRFTRIKHHRPGMRLLRCLFFGFAKRVEWNEFRTTACCCFRLFRNFVVEHLKPIEFRLSSAIAFSSRDSANYFSNIFFSFAIVKMQQFCRVHDLQLRNVGALPRTELKLLLGFNSNHLLNFAYKLS